MSNNQGTPIRSVPLFVPRTPPQGFIFGEIEAETFEEPPRLGPTTPESNDVGREPIGSAHPPTVPPEKFIWLPRLQQNVPLKTYLLYKAEHTGDQLHLGMSSSSQPNLTSYILSRPCC